MAKSDDWSTPPDLAAALYAEFGFTLEVAAAADNRAIPKIPYMGLDNGQDALTMPWGEKGDVMYCNPPYSQLPAFITKAEHAAWHGPVVLLIPAYTDTKIWQFPIAHRAAEIRFLAGRIRFWDKEGPGKDTARFPSAVVVFKPPFGVRSGGPAITFWDWRA